MRDVDARRPEADPGQRRGQHHPAARLLVAGDGVAQVAAAVLERLRRPDVGDRRRPLVGRAVARRRRPLALRERPGDERLGGVADHVEPARGHHLGGQRGGQRRVDDRLVRPQVAVRDAGLHVLLGDVEDRHGRRLGAGAAGGGDRQQRLERGRRLAPAADRRVHVLHELAAVGGDQVGDLGGVDARPAADPDEAVEAAVDREGGGLGERGVGRLDARAVPHLGLDPRGLDRLLHAAGDPGGRHAGIRCQHRSLHAEALELPARLGGGAGPVLERRRLEREDLLVRQRVPAVSRNRSRSKRFSRTSSRSSCSSAWTSLS